MPQLQTIQGLPVYVIEFPDRASIKKSYTCGGDKALAPYATALNLALQQGLVDRPGKYGIHIGFATNTWNIFRINE